jgi:hypothetical protein
VACDRDAERLERVRTGAGILAPGHHDFNKRSRFRPGRPAQASPDVPVGVPSRPARRRRVLGAQCLGTEVVASRVVPRAVGRNGKLPRPSRSRTVALYCSVMSDVGLKRTTMLMVRSSKSPLSGERNKTRLNPGSKRHYAVVLATTTPLDKAPVSRPGHPVRPSDGRLRTRRPAHSDAGRALDWSRVCVTGAITPSILQRRQHAAPVSGTVV